MTSVSLRRADFVILSIFIMVQLSALFLLSYFPQQVQVFDDPGDPGNSVLYVALFILVTGSILFILTLRMMFLLRLMMVGVMVAGAALSFALLIHIIITPVWEVILTSLFLSVLLISTTLVTKHRHLMNVTAAVLCVGAIVILGASLSPMPALLLLATLSLYDYWAVRRTGHMQVIAAGVLEAELPLLFRQREEGGSETAVGLGDVALPGMLAASAMYHLPIDGNLPGANVFLAIAIIAGGALGFLLLLGRLDETPAPGLPWINGGAILALAIAYPLMFVL